MLPKLFKRFFLPTKTRFTGALVLIMFLTLIF
nr:MAG TPA: hypothetical protein [Caudoviricetes sp.]